MIKGRKTDLCLFPRSQSEFESLKTGMNWQALVCHQKKIMAQEAELRKQKLEEEAEHHPPGSFFVGAEMIEEMELIKEEPVEPPECAEVHLESAESSQRSSISSQKTNSTVDSCMSELIMMKDSESRIEIHI